MLVIILFLLLALFLQTGYQTVQLSRERALLKNAFERQQSAIQKAQNMRSQLESLAGETAVLAEQGNQNAQKLVATLKAQGIEIHPPKSTP